MLSMSEGCCSGGCCCSSGCTPEIQTVSTKLSWRDVLGSWKVRWGIGRMSYRVEPGLYKVGQPDAGSPVLVSANYKMTFDSLRRELGGLNCYLLILDTKGVNVWCAAGKGTFGTDELIRQIRATGLSDVISTHTLILPQLGAPGVDANEVKRETGFSVVYGPVYARDIPAFLGAGCRADDAMREVRFGAWNRLVLTPIELVAALKLSMPVFAAMFVLNLFAARPFGLWDFWAYMGALLCGAVLTPLLLPWIPGRAFTFKGALLGLAWAIIAAFCAGWFRAGDWLLAGGYLLALPALAGYLAMNFTGSSTYTSFSGVLKEMKIAIPILLVCAVVGAALLLIQAFV